MSKPYVTILDGKDLRHISSIMNGKGYKMNHATVRNIFLSGISEIIREVMKDCGTENDDVLNNILKDKSAMNSFQDILNTLYLEKRIAL